MYFGLKICISCEHFIFGMAAYQVHKCRFVEWNASAIVSSAFSHSGNYLAVSRSNGSIEVWNIVHQWFLQLVCNSP